MPAWIHDRAEHILAKNPKMKKTTAFAIATQQSHKLGKSPKGYGTAEGKRIAKAKYRGSKKGYVKSPNPGKLDSSKMKKAGVIPTHKVVMETTGSGAESIAEIAKRIHKRGNTGHSFGILEEGVKAEGLGGWDGDGNDRIAKITILNPDNTSKVTYDQKNKKLAYVVSQYSGPLSLGAFKQESQQPSFRSPPVKTGGPPSEKKKVAALRDVVDRMDKISRALSAKGRGQLKEKRAYDPSPVGGPGGMGNVHVPGMRKMRTPALGLQASKRVGQLKELPPGPSISQVAKPIGFGKPIPGASKAQNFGS